MTHPRRIIRDSIAAHLLAGNTAAATRVWASREPPVKVETVLIDQGPVILVYTRSDTVRPEDYPPAGAGKVRRTLEIAVEITAVGGDVVDDKLDELTEQVEALMDGFEVPGQPATEIRLQSTEIDTSDEFEMPLGGALMIYEAKYWKDWRVEPEDEWFPTTVIANGDQVASCEDCTDGECP